ncbi:divergent polysaccharide deacetylase family protein [Tabrizicola oligotrophica]|uniref:Divergent polysaccharide deacetylase family protein n=1 Tax=Tabrizicola oligotrophica TaxID=2710650 RepID=A0A6M0QUW4_9RHOB|nr:divergent polysaccharide deacetylase family protein [Tabrizicola oligotrophica]NEY91278.1 hypothetical protein [Tabrizicola oligotrophica]
MTGVLWGGVVAAGGLAVVSLLTPIRTETGAEPQESAGPMTPEPAGPQEATPEAVPAPPSVAPGNAPPQVVADPEPLAETETATELDEPLLRPLAAAGAPPPASVVPDIAEPATPAETPKVDPAPVAPETPEPAAKAEAATEPAAAPEVGGGEAPEPAEAPSAEVPAEGGGETAQEPKPEDAEAEALVPEAPASPAAEAEGADLPQVEAMPPAAAEPAPSEAAPSETATATAPETGTPAAGTLAPDAQLGESTVDGVTTGRLPSIAAAPEAGQPDAPIPEASAPAIPTLPTPAPDAAEEAPALVPAEAPADLPPLRRYARPFENPDAKPLFVILLVDTGAADVPRAELAALPFPVTFVLDPMAQGAAEAAAIYRAAGQEVVMLATGIPQGATPGDLEQSFAGLEGRLPEAVALIDTAAAAFQEDRKLSAEVVTLLAVQGRGLITFDRGLNAADQVARREGLPSATIFRSLDDDGEEAPLIRRYLDRAAFKAAQEGEVAVIGTARRETITALLEWTVEGRSASVALAPITALMDGR